MGITHLNMTFRVFMGMVITAGKNRELLVVFSDSQSISKT